MSIRPLPELRAPVAKPDVTFELTDRAVAAWSPATPAMAQGDAVITILEQIGFDWWTGGGVTANGVRESLKAIGEKPVTVLINSPGGDFFEGVTIYNMLRAHPAKVTVEIVGIAASAASVVAMAGDEIQIAKLGFVMMHNTQWCCCGDRHAMIETAEIMATFDEAANAMYADRTGKPIAEIAAMMDAETWLTGQQAVDAGFADALLDIDLLAAPAKAEARLEKPPLYRLEAALASGKPMPRADRRKLLREIAEGTPRAAVDDATPRAGDDGGDASDHLNLALAALTAAG